MKPLLLSFLLVVSGWCARATILAPLDQATDTVRGGPVYHSGDEIWAAITPSTYEVANKIPITTDWSVDGGVTWVRFGVATVPANTSEYGVWCQGLTPVGPWVLRRSADGFPWDFKYSLVGGVPAVSVAWRPRVVGIAWHGIPMSWVRGRK